MNVAIRSRPENTPETTNEPSIQAQHPMTYLCLVTKSAFSDLSATFATGWLLPQLSVGIPMLGY